MLNDDFHQEMKENILILEELLNEANWRSMGGFGTSDQKFALNTYNILREFLIFFNKLSGDLEELESEIASANDFHDDQIDNLLDKIAEIREFVVRIENESTNY